jgi:hypothetical protein
MRLWSLHPRYLDARGLVALWREALLAQAVLAGKTRGYRNHPQLDRFRRHRHPRRAIALYLRAVHDEAAARGYAFDRTRISRVRGGARLTVTEGQLEYEWSHLLSKLGRRSPGDRVKWSRVRGPDPHPLFRVRPGGVEAWERVPEPPDGPTTSGR